MRARLVVVPPHVMVVVHTPIAMWGFSVLWTWPDDNLAKAGNEVVSTLEPVAILELEGRHSHIPFPTREVKSAYPQRGAASDMPR